MDSTHAIISLYRDAREEAVPSYATATSLRTAGSTEVKSCEITHVIVDNACPKELDNTV
jgi:hypothetical protein